MKKVISFVMALMMTLLVPISAYAAPTEEQVKLPSGLSVSELEAKIDAYVTEHEATTAAMSVAVFSGDEVLLEKAYGYTNIENNLKTTEDSVFEWGSCTKLITWTCVMQLVEQGKIDLNEDIRSYLPEGFLKKLSYDTPITMMNLMNHSAGWQESVTDLFLANAEDVMSLGDALQYMEPEQIYEPGTRVAYSNWGTGLAGYIVECVSGQDYVDYVQEHIFAPLGMEHTAIAADLSDNEWVKEQRMLENCYEADGTSKGTCFYYIPLPPAGMATGTIGDFVKFGQAFVPQDGEPSPLFEKRETLDEMQSPTLYFADGKTARNCHGFWTDEYSVPLLWHNGGTAGSTSWFAYNIETGVGTVILTNQSGESVYTCGILPMVFGENEYTPLRDTGDISGTYRSLRTCLKGVGKPYTLFCYMGFEPPVDGQYAAMGMNIANIGENQYMLDMGGKLYQFFVAEDADGTRVLQLPGADYEEVNGFGVIMQCVLLFLFLVAVFYAFIMLILGVIRLLGSRKKPFEVARLINNFAVLISFNMVVYMVLTLLGESARFVDVKWSAIGNGICMLVPVGYVVTLILKWKKTEMSKGEKAGAIVNAVMGLMMTANILFWNSFMFW
ncbi:MAG TPA: serine hydrolase domain-containing protein [Lachnospiraceae bacterium]|nr:serine hydrolase domain-containing protein [Lachnospiraceae bacterium]